MQSTMQNGTLNFGGNGTPYVVLSAGGVTVTLHFSEHVSIISVLFYKNSWIRSLCLLKRPEISHCRDVDEAIRFPFQRQFRKEK